MVIVLSFFHLHDAALPYESTVYISFLPPADEFTEPGLRLGQFYGAVFYDTPNWYCLLLKPLAVLATTRFI